MTTDAMPAAILWDMDGTIVDTEPYWMDAEVELITSWGGHWTHEDGLAVVGTGLEDSARIFQSRGVGLEVQQIIDLLTDKVLERVAVEVPWRPGSRELMAEVKAAGIRTALVTMSIGRMAHRIVDAMPAGTFDVIVTGETVRAKPHPEPYLRAAELLGVDPADTIAIEDSEPGVASAVASGATTIAMPMHVALPESPAYELWADGPVGKRLDDLIALHRRGRAA